MKTRSNLAYVARLTFTLLAIAIVVAALLAVVSGITQPIIAQRNEEKTQNAIKLVLPSGYEEEVTGYTDATGLVSRVYRGAGGYAVEVNPVGFDSAITMMVGVDPEGKVLGISIISHTESAGLGAVAAAGTSAGTAFRDQFVGQSGQVLVNKDGGQIDAITNATITSRAICDGVNAALDCVAALQGGAA